MPVPSAETYSFAEGKLFVYASASGVNASGSGVAFTENARLNFVYGWRNRQDLDMGYRNFLTGKRCDISIEHLVADSQLFRLANASAALHVRFEGVVTGGRSQSAIWQFYSGVVDQADITQRNGGMFAGGLALHANEWSAFGE